MFGVPHDGPYELCKLTFLCSTEADSAITHTPNEAETKDSE